MELKVCIGFRSAGGDGYVKLEIFEKIERSEDFN